MLEQNFSKKFTSVAKHHIPIFSASNSAASTQRNCCTSWVGIVLTLVKADKNVKSYIPLEMAAIFFFLGNLFLKKGISWEYVIVEINCMGYKEQKPRITKWKILAHSGTWTHDPWITSLVATPWGHHIWNTNDNFKI